VNVGFGVLWLGQRVVTAFVPRVAQDPAYHNFADTRAALGIPNFLNVVSNLPFLVVGALGLAFLARDARRGGGDAFASPAERRPYWPFFSGVALTAVGSGYYHWQPSNDTLFWDRLPMTLAFMALLASVIGERISLRAGGRLLWPLLLAGALSAHYGGFITPVKSSFLHSVELVIMVVFGGMASVFGAVVGAAVLTVLPQLLTVLKDYEMMVFGAVLVATMVLFPQGLVPTVARWWKGRPQ